MFQHQKTNQEAQQIFHAQIAAFQKANQPIVYIDESGFA